MKHKDRKIEKWRLVNKNPELKEEVFFVSQVSNEKVDYGWTFLGLKVKIHRDIHVRKYQRSLLR